MTTTTTSERPEQLSLLPEATVPVQFRLDEATRRRGLAHIAEIRALLEQSSRARSTSTPTLLRPRSAPAAHAGAPTGSPGPAHAERHAA
jgi:hypothetical protein